MIIEQNCTTCELHTDDCIGASDPCSRWISSRAALEAEVERLTKERHDALAQAAARDDEIAALRAQAEDWAAQYRALSARMESELGGLRHSLAEVEDERDKAVSAMAEWRARALLGEAKEGGGA